MRLSRAVDAHDVGRGRGSIQEVLSTIKARTLVIGITSDILFTIEDAVCSPTIFREPLSAP